MEQHQQEQLEEQHLMEQEEEENRKALEIQKQELRLEMQSMAEKGYQEKVNLSSAAADRSHSSTFQLLKHVLNFSFQIHSRPRSAWT